MLTSLTRRFSGAFAEQRRLEHALRQTWKRLSKYEKTVFLDGLNDILGAQRFSHDETYDRDFERFEQVYQKLTHQDQDEIDKLILDLNFKKCPPLVYSATPAQMAAIRVALCEAWVGIYLQTLKFGQLSVRQICALAETLDFWKIYYAEDLLNRSEAELDQLIEKAAAQSRRHRHSGAPPGCADPLAPIDLQQLVRELLTVLPPGQYAKMLEILRLDVR